MIKKEELAKCLDRIQEWALKYPAKEYLYRGQGRDYTGGDESKRKITSSMFRQLPPDAGMTAEHLEKTVVAQAKQSLYPPHASNLEVVTDIQHHGGRTNCIDFTRSLPVALFFACHDSPEEDGELFFLKYDQLEALTEIHYPQSLELNEVPSRLSIFEPAVSFGSKGRVATQSSVFVRSAHGYIPKELCEGPARVSKQDKQRFLACLAEVFRISWDSLFKDIPGFVANKRNFETSALNYAQARAAFNRDGEIKDFLQRLNDILLKDPDYAPAFHERGRMRFYHGDIASAINDFSEALKRNYTIVDCWRWRGAAYILTKDYESAQRDIGQINIEDRTDADYFLSAAIKHGLGDKEGALQELDKASESRGRDEYRRIRKLLEDGKDSQ